VLSATLDIRILGAESMRVPLVQNRNRFVVLELNVRPNHLVTS